MSNFGGIVGCIEKVITDRAVFCYIAESFRITFTSVLVLLWFETGNGYINITKL